MSNTISITPASGDRKLFGKKTITLVLNNFPINNETDAADIIIQTILYDDAKSNT